MERYRDIGVKPPDVLQRVGPMRTKHIMQSIS
jgi:hypothetical protein